MLCSIQHISIISVPFTVGTGPRTKNANHPDSNDIFTECMSNKGSYSPVKAIWISVRLILLEGSNCFASITDYTALLSIC